MIDERKLIADLKEAAGVAGVLFVGEIERIIDKQPHLSKTTEPHDNGWINHIMNRFTEGD